MNSLALQIEPLAHSVQCTDDDLIVVLDDGRTLTVPLAWFPRLVAASPSDRARYELLGHGEGIHWPSVDEDISVIGLLAGRLSVESRASSN